MAIWFGVDSAFYFLCAFGAFVLYSQMKSNGWKVIQFLTHFDKTLGEFMVVRYLEAIIFSIVGGIFAAIITQPTNASQALMAGVGWTGLVGAISEKVSKERGGGS